jgi:hypothetical protein
VNGRLYAEEIFHEKKFSARPFFKNFDINVFIILPNLL